MPDRVLVVLVAGDLLPAFPENAASAVEGGRWREAIAVRRSASDTSKQIKIERGMFSRVMQRWQRSRWLDRRLGTRYRRDPRRD